MSDEINRLPFFTKMPLVGIPEPPKEFSRDIFMRRAADFGPVIAPGCFLIRPDLVTADELELAMDILTDDLRRHRLRGQPQVLADRFKRLVRSQRVGVCGWAADRLLAEMELGERAAAWALWQDDGGGEGG